MSQPPIRTLLDAVTESHTHASRRAFELIDSCLGCTSRRGSGEKAWCSNQKLPMDKRPMGAAMKGCELFSTDKSERQTSMAKGLARIASRRSSR